MRLIKKAYEEAVKLLKYTVIEEVPSFTELTQYGKGFLELHPILQVVLDDSMEGVKKEGEEEYDVNPQKWMGKWQVRLVNNYNHFTPKVVECGNTVIGLGEFANRRFKAAKFEATVWQAERMEVLQSYGRGVTYSEIEDVVNERPPDFPELGFPRQVERLKNEEDYSSSELPELMHPSEVN